MFQGFVGLFPLSWQLLISRVPFHTRSWNRLKQTRKALQGGTDVPLGWAPKLRSLLQYRHWPWDKRRFVSAWRCLCCVFLLLIYRSSHSKLWTTRPAFLSNPSQPTLSHQVPSTTPSYAPKSFSCKAMRSPTWKHEWSGRPARKTLLRRLRKTQKETWCGRYHKWSENQQNFHTSSQKASPPEPLSSECPHWSSTYLWSIISFGRWVDAS